jgi:hypothetical protein
MIYIKVIFMFFIISASTQLQANDLFSFIKQINKYLVPQGLKVQDYRPALNDIRGYELNLTISNPSLATTQEPVKQIFINKDFNTAILIYNIEAIHKNLRNDTHLNLIKMFTKIFQQEEKYYKRLPLFKESVITPYNEDINLFYDSERSFIINNEKTFMASADVLFFNGEEISNYSEDKRKNSLFELKQIVKNIYEKQEQITFIPNNMKNLAVIFFSNSLPYTQEIFKNISSYNKEGLGLLFLPYYDIQKDKNTTKDYQLFCQKDFGLVVEYAILEGTTAGKEFKCADSSEEKIQASTELLISIYKARADILNKFDLDSQQPYYYLYKQDLFIDYDMHKELN